MYTLLDGTRRGAAFGEQKLHEHGKQRDHDDSDHNGFEVFLDPSDVAEEDASADADADPQDAAEDVVDEEGAIVHEAGAGDEGDEGADDGDEATQHDGFAAVCFVEGVGAVEVFEPVGESWLLRIRAPKALARFLAYKGSITVNGVSLTVNSVADADDGSTAFDINLIPHTIENTALGELQAGSSVNLEVDLIARYVERMLSAEGKLPVSA